MTREERIKAGRRRRRRRAFKKLSPVLALAVIAGILWAMYSLVSPYLFPGPDEAEAVSPALPEPMPTPTIEPLIITPNWESTLVNAAIVGDDPAGEAAAVQVGVSYEDLRLLAQIMAAESGPNWPDFFIMAIGEVVLNRVASPEWPDTVPAVLHQYGQYEPVMTGAIENIMPTERVVRLALRLLQGERALGDESVVWQALKPQGEQAVTIWYDSDLGTTTYFCR